MDSVNAVASHILLNKKEKEDSHSIEKSGAASAYSSYGYGPLDLPDENSGSKAAKPASGTSSIAAASAGASVPFLAHLAASQMRS